MTLPKVITKKETTSWGLTYYITGPGLDETNCPTFVYFSLSGDQSLTLEPYNSPVAHLTDSKIRCLSLDLPGHGEGCDPNQALSFWASEMKAGRHPLSDFLEETRRLIDTLIDQGVIDPKRLAVGGLSRGGFMATHLAAREPRIQTVLAFAPMTSLSYSTDFSAIASQPTVQQMSLPEVAESLVDRHLRFYIGNRDVLVSTDNCFSFIRLVTELAYARRVRSPETELIISPSIGHRGHGTPPHIFADGALWIRNRIGLKQ